MPISTDNISPEKMTFLTANYGLTSDQVKSFAQGFSSAYYAMAGEIEYTWEECGFYPEDSEGAMIECLVDADRLERFIPDYMEWCFNFLFKMELVYDLMNETPPEWCRNFLTKKDMTWWTAVQHPLSYRK